MLNYTKYGIITITYKKFSGTMKYNRVFKNIATYK